MKPLIAGAAWSTPDGNQNNPTPFERNDVCGIARKIAGCTVKIAACGPLGPFIKSKLDNLIAERPKFEPPEWAIGTRCRHQLR